MPNTDACDPDFDDEDEENEEAYRQLLKNRGTLPPCSPTTTPASSISQRCTLCSRVEAENILKTMDDVRPGNFIVRPSVHPNHPYSLTVLFNDNSIYHFQIGETSKNYVIGPLDTVDLTKAKIFPSLSALLEYYLKSSIKLQENNDKEHSVFLKLYSSIETTQF